MSVPNKTSKLHFISGLPRSGSTLLSALLSQNPRFYAGMSSPVCGLVSSLLEKASANNEFSTFIDDEKRRRILAAVSESFYADNKAEVIFDTSRAWCSRMSLINSLYPNAKVIACVRDMPWIIDSIEQLVQKNAFQPSSIFNYLVGGTVYSRVDAVAKSDGMVGFAYNALKEAFFGGYAENRLLLVRYESLVARPKEILNEIYKFIGEPAYEHDLNNIIFNADDFDKKAGTPGLHHVRPKVSSVTRKTLLPPDLFQRFENDAFWNNPIANPGNVRIL